jgi:hypothetical protein
VARNRFVDIPAGLTPQQVIDQLRMCKTCACIYYKGQFNARGPGEDPYMVDGDAIHMAACANNLGIGIRIPPQNTVT